MAQFEWSRRGHLFKTVMEQQAKARIEERTMKGKIVISLGAVALLAVFLAAQPAFCNQSSAGVSAAVFNQEAAQVQREVQAELAKAQAEIARAMEEIKSKTAAKVHKAVAAKLAAHRGAMLADLHARQAELAALAQEKASRVVEPSS